MTYAAYPDLVTAEDCCEALAIRIAEAGFQHRDFAKLQSIADQLLDLGHYTPLLAELMYDLPDNPPPLSDIESGFDFAPDTETRILIILAALVRHAPPVEALQGVDRFWIEQSFELNRPALNQLVKAYYDLDEPPGVWVSMRKREAFAQEACRTWTTTFYAEVQAIPRIPVPPLA